MPPAASLHIPGKKGCLYTAVGKRNKSKLNTMSEASPELGMVLGNPTLRTITEILEFVSA